MVQVAPEETWIVYGKSRSGGMKLIRTVGLLAAMTGAAVPLPSQGGEGRGGGKPPARIRGVVTDLSGQAVEGARVDVHGLGLSAVTGADGSYRIEGIKPERYWVAAKGPGLEPQRKAVTLEPGDDREIGFTLVAVSITVAEARAGEMDSLYRDFAVRLTQSLDGVFLTRDDIFRSQQPLLGQVIAHYLVPLAPRTAVRFRDPAAGFTSTGCAPWESWMVHGSRRWAPDPQAYPFISVDGARPFRSRALYEFDPNLVEAIEVYRGAATYFNTVPTANQCGLVIIWTK